MSRERKGLSELRSGKSGAAGLPRRADSPAGPRPPQPLSPCLPVPLSRAELYFLIARFLEDGPCQQAAQVGGARRGPGASRWPPAGVGEGGGGGGAAARGAGLSGPRFVVAGADPRSGREGGKGAAGRCVPSPSGLCRAAARVRASSGARGAGRGGPWRDAGRAGEGSGAGRAGGRAYRASCPCSCCPGAPTGLERSTPGPTRIW